MIQGTINASGVRPAMRAELAPTGGPPAFAGRERLCAPDPTGEPRAGGWRNHQASGRFPTAEAVLNVALKPAAKAEREWRSHGAVLLNRINHSTRTKEIPDPTLAQDDLGHVDKLLTQSRAATI